MNTRQLIWIFSKVFNLGGCSIWGADTRMPHKMERLTKWKKKWVTYYSLLVLNWVWLIVLD